MTLRHLKIFTAVYREGSITQAAKTLHLAQPSVSVAVKELEEHYGVCLFERVGRNIRVTETGRLFYEYAEHIVNMFEEMEAAMTDRDALGSLRIGASITIGTHIMPKILKMLQSEFPDLKLEAVIRQSACVEDMVFNHSVDIGLIENQPFNENLWTRTFRKDRLCAIVPPGHPLTGRGTVRLKDMANYPFLMREPGSAGREILEHAFALEGLTVKPLLESAATQSIVRSVEEGLGVAVLPELLVRQAVEEGTVVQVPLRPVLKRNLLIIRHPRKFVSEAMRRLETLCMESK